MTLADDVEERRLAAVAGEGAVLPSTLPLAVRERIDRMTSFLTQELGEPVRFLGQAPGASHEGWVFRVGETSGGKVVVRIEPEEGPFLDYDGARESMLLRQLAVHGFPVPRVLAEGGREHVGARFLVLEWIEGQVLNPRTASDMTPTARQRHAQEMAEQLARLHLIPWRALAGPEGGGDEELDRGELVDEDDGLDEILEQFGRALAQLRVVDSLVLDFVHVWLMRHARERTVQRSIVHGDFRLGNLVWRDDVIVGILDWETATVGDPVFDIAWMCMGATKGSDPIMGLVSRDQFVELYSRASGRAINPADLLFWQVVAAWVRGCTEARLLDI